MRLTELFQIESAITKLTESANREAALSANTQRFLKQQLNEARKAVSQQANVINFPSKNR